MNNKNTQQLMKHFASVLRKRSASGTTNLKTEVGPNLLKHLSRKELVHILQSKHKGTIPKELDLVELENEQLLTLIGDELFILAHLVPKWCEMELIEAQKTPIKTQEPQKEKAPARPTKKS